MTPQLLQQALDALDAALSDDQPYIERSKAAITALREALTAPEQEPVTWQFRWTNPGNKPDVRPYELEWCEVVQTNSMYTIADAAADLLRHEFNGKPCYEVRPLYAAPPAAPAPAAPVPDGWVMVPREPNEAMMDAGERAFIATARPGATWAEHTGNIYRAMIAASPAAPAAPVVPLTDSELAKIAVEDEFLLYCDQDSFNEIARAIEAAHGITGASK